MRRLMTSALLLISLVTPAQAASPKAERVAICR